MKFIINVMRGFHLYKTFARGCITVPPMDLLDLKSGAAVHLSFESDYYSVPYWPFPQHTTFTIESILPILNHQQKTCSYQLSIGVRQNHDDASCPDPTNACRSNFGTPPPTSYVRNNTVPKKTDVEEVPLPRQPHITLIMTSFRRRMSCIMTTEVRLITIMTVRSEKYWTVAPIPPNFLYHILSSTNCLPPHSLKLKPTLTHH